MAPRPTAPGTRGLGIGWRAGGPESADAVAARLPAPPVPSSSRLPPEAVGRAAGGRGSGGGRAGGEEAGPPHWLRPGAAAGSQSERSLGRASSGGRASAAQPHPPARRADRAGRRALPREAGEPGRCCGPRHGRAAPAAAAAAGGESGRDRNPEGSHAPSPADSGASESLMLGAGGGPGPPMPRPTGKRPGTSERTGKPRSQGGGAG